MVVGVLDNYTDFRPNAHVVKDSISEQGHRVTTIEVEHHRFILSELLMHRVFARNGGSSRAVRALVQVERAQTRPAFPLAFGTNQPRMQPGPPLTGVEEEKAYAIWAAARDAAVESAKQLIELDVHKEVVNRLLEPFLPQKTIITATSWDGFLAQRCSNEDDDGLAQREMRAAADAIRDALAGSEPELVPDGGWHLPMILEDEDHLPLDTKIKVAEARCARVSYLTHKGIREIDQDLKLYNNLVTADPPHWSPLEHVCTPDASNVQQVTVTGRTGRQLTYTTPRVGALIGWAQDRHLVEADRFGGTVGAAAS